MAISLPLPGTFDEAISWAKARGVVLPDDFYNTVATDARGRAFTVSYLTSLAQIQVTLDSLTESLAQGETFEQWKERAGETVGTLTDAHMETVFRNFHQNAYNAGRWKQFEANKDSFPYLMFSAINDARTTDICRHRNGIIRRADDPFWQRNSPQMHHNCFLPGTMVRGDFEIGLKSLYSGPAVEITTQSGLSLSVTINHPILTRRGWVGAQEIKEGDDLLSYTGGGNPSAVGVVNNQNPPASVEYVFEALSGDAMGIAKISTFDFQSDMRFRKGDVQVSGSKCILMDGFKAKVNQGIQDRYFVRATKSMGVSLAAMCRTVSSVMRSVFHKNTNHIRWTGIEFFRQRVAAFVHVLIGVHNRRLQNIITMFGGFPCFSALTFNASRRFFDLFPFNQFGFTSSSNWNLVSFEKSRNGPGTDTKRFSNFFSALSRAVSANNIIRRIGRPLPQWDRPISPDYSGFLHGSDRNAMVSQQSPEETIANSSLFENLAHGSAGLIEPDQVKRVRYFTFSGHVYDFQTVNGIILANGIITHNCRSTLISLTESQAARRSRGPTGINKPTPKDEPGTGWGYKPTAEDAARGLAEAVKSAAGAAPPGWFETIMGLFASGWSFLSRLLASIF